MTKRVRGGFRGLLSAIAAEWLDPEDGTSAREDAPFVPFTPAEHRARELRDHRREKKAAKRSPF